MKWRFYPLAEDACTGILKGSGKLPVVAEFLTPQEAKGLRLRELQRARGQ